MKTAIPLLLLFAFLFSSCEREYHIEYIVGNLNAKRISIVYQDVTTGVVDSNVINAGQVLTFKIEMGIGQNTCDYLDELDALPFDFFRIRDIDGKAPDFDEQDINEWHKSCPQEKDIGSVSLNLHHWQFN